MHFNKTLRYSKEKKIVIKIWKFGQFSGSGTKP